MTQQNRFAEAIITATGTRANIIKSDTYALGQGELATATDVNRMYVGNASNEFKDLMGFIAPHIICLEENIITKNNEVVYIT